MTTDELVNFIMPGASDNNRAILSLLLDNRLNRSISPVYDEADSVPQPSEESHGIRFNYSFDELVDITNRLTPGNRDDLTRVLRYALVWSGMRVDERLTHWVTTDHGYNLHTRLPRVTLPIHDKRLSIRVVPNSWKNSYGTPFILHKSDKGIRISIYDRNGNQVEIDSPNQRYITESVQTLAYVKNQLDGTIDITINPLQRCPQRCEFCCRGYHDMTRDRLRELINLSPAEMARYLKVKFPKIDWKGVSGITIVTGDFLSGKAIIEYVQGFIESMIYNTSNQWNPLTNAHQNIAVSTHLLQSKYFMEAAKKLGMKRFIYTAELADDVQRGGIMYVSRTAKNSTINKGYMSFTKVLGVIETAIDVFGADAVEPVLVIGLDSLEQTIRSLEKLKKLGIKRVSRALFNVYNMNQFTLARSSFEDAVVGMQHAKNLFDSPHSRVVYGDDPFANTRELFS